MSRIGQTYNAKNEKIYPKIVIGSIISDPSVDNLDETNNVFDHEVGRVVSSELAKDEGVSFRKINLLAGGSITNSDGSNIISVEQQKVNIQTDNFSSTHIKDDSESLIITDASVSNLSVDDISVTNNSYDILKQYIELPEPSSVYDGKVIQYIGPTYHEDEDDFVCYSMVKCVMDYDASKELYNPEYLKSDFDSFDSTKTYTWLTENYIECSVSGDDKTYTFYPTYENNSYIVRVENERGERVELGGSSVQSSHLRHMYCPYVWNATYKPPQTDDGLLSYDITFHTSKYVWRPQMPRKMETVSLQSISLSYDNLETYYIENRPDIQDSIELEVTYNPSNATNKKVTWKSSDDSVVSVSNGIIELKGVGTATITATSDDGDHKASCDVSVNQYIDVERVVVEPIVIGVDGSVDVNDKCTIVPDKDTLTDAQITYTIYNESVATCDSNGIITGRSVGDTSLTVQVTTRLDDIIVNDASVESTITVYQPLESIEIPSTLELGHNSTGVINLTVNPSTADIESVIWWSNSDIISVEPIEPFNYSATVKSSDTNGVVTVTCIATDKLEKELRKTCEVTVSGGTVEDIFTAEKTGIETTNKYESFEGKTINSSAVYAGIAAVSSNDAVQLNGKSNYGIVTTASGGTVRKVSVDWGEGTPDGRTLNVYGRNDPYNSSADLYSNDSSIGTIVYGKSTELDIGNNYSYVGLRSKEGVMYLRNIKITWEVKESQNLG